MKSDWVFMKLKKWEEKYSRINAWSAGWVSLPTRSPIENYLSQVIAKKIAFSVFAVLMEAISVRHSFAKYDYLNLFEIASMMRHI
jgi:hypothetical protein